MYATISREKNVTCTSISYWGEKEHCIAMENEVENADMSEKLSRLTAYHSNPADGSSLKLYRVSVFKINN